ncbi:MAG: hypothetical protein IKM82_04140, partial [Oscillospiraceae bacterium]|nr:hypothetical protein [Oscillospiraceae bacterium]
DNIDSLCRQMAGLFPKRTADVHETTRKVIARESRIGSISSEVERNTAISVPLVISPSVNRLAVAAENPHCGITPSALPMACPHFPARWISAMV